MAEAAIGEYEKILQDLDDDISNCRRWLNAIRAFFERSEDAYMRYKEELRKLDHEIKKADAMQTIDSVNHVMATAMRAELCIRTMHEYSRRIIKGSIADERIIIAAKDDVDKVTSLPPDSVDKATIYGIYSKLRLAYVELRKLIKVADDVDDALNSEAGRLHEVGKYAEKAKEIVQKWIDKENKVKHANLVGNARQHSMDRYLWYEEKREEEKTVKQREEFRLATHRRLEIAMKHFRKVMEVEEEELNKDVKAEYGEIARISTIEQNLKDAESALHMAA